MSATILPRRAGASPWIARAARLGTAATGFLYVVVCVLAVGVVAGAGGKTTSGKGALAALGSTGWGRALVLVLAAGFAGYALWRVVLAVRGRRIESGEREDVPHRAWYLFRAAVHASLCWSAISVASGSGAGGGGEERQTAQLLGLPGGRWLVLAIGLAVVGYGVAAAYEGISRRFEDQLELGRMSAAERRWPCRLGVFGHVARGLVFGLAGAFLVKAAVEFDPEESRGLDGALAELAQQPYGRALLGVVAAGLGAYGLFSIAVRARYRKV